MASENFAFRFCNVVIKVNSKFYFRFSISKIIENKHSHRKMN